MEAPEWPAGVRVFVDDGRGRWAALPRFYGDSIWSACGLVMDSTHVPRADHVAIADVDDDGRRDVVVAGACMTGIGPDGAAPFAVGTVYLQRQPGRFVVDAARDSAFSGALPAACAEYACDILASARGVVRR